MYNTYWYGIGEIGVMIVLAIVLSIVLILASYLLSFQKWDSEKLSPYECGFEPFMDARQNFDIRFYLISLLFILFDLEVVYLFPLVSLQPYALMEGGYYVGVLFIVVLTVGFVYEWSQKALDNI